MSWQNPASAPKDGSPCLLDFGFLDPCWGFYDINVGTWWITRKANPAALEWDDDMEMDIGDFGVSVEEMDAEELLRWHPIAPLPKLAG